MKKKNYIIVTTDLDGKQTLCQSLCKDFYTRKQAIKIKEFIEKPTVKTHTVKIYKIKEVKS